jgi:hypothetical protein
VPIGAGGRLDLKVQREAVGVHERSQHLKAGQGLTCIGPAVPAAGIDAREGRPVQFPCDATPGRGAIERGVVQQEGHTVGTELHVTLESVIAMGGSQPEGCQGVLGG